jgi:3-methyladenine DNA glycosylase AlkD
MPKMKQQIKENLLIKEIRQELKKNSSETAKRSAQSFFKDEIEAYGVKSPIVTKIAKKHFKNIPDKNKKAVFSLCEELWKSGLIEESFVACNWTESCHKHFEPRDIEVFEKWINKYVSNWASCDTFCNHTIGSFIEMYPKYLSRLKTWAKSKNRWVRRASAVSLIVPAKRGKFLKDVFEIADRLLLDKEDMVQKGYGWMLKVASQAHQKEVFDYVIKNKDQMPRTALRYAIEKMPQELRRQAMF